MGCGVVIPYAGRAQIVREELLREQAGYAYESMGLVRGWSIRFTRRTDEGVVGSEQATVRLSVARSDASFHHKAGTSEEAVVDRLKVRGFRAPDKSDPHHTACDVAYYACILVRVT